MRRVAMISAVITLVLLAILAGAALWLYTPDKPRAALEAAYAQPPSQFVMIDGIRIHLRDTGARDAPALILLHGFGSSLHTWEDWALALSADYRVIRFDLPGFGLTGSDPTGDYTDERTIAVIADLMDERGLARAVLIGNSMGGRFAWRFAASHPERVSKLVLISPDGFASPGIAYGERPSVPFLMRALPYTLPMAMLRPNLTAAYADTSHLTDALAERYRDMMLAPGVRHAIVARMAQVVLKDPVPLLHELRMPTLLLWGERDALIPFGNAADYMAALPNATLVPLPGVGHLPQEEVPAASLAPLRAFLAR